ncbi:MAG: DUF1704 domain-containing protein [Candidatus Woesearchaeota archaeon]|jgi:hypothetical protein|nr:DUF1704 domain-containing protein [Candidatus Woesearchaeota archaeon]
MNGEEKQYFEEIRNFEDKYYSLISNFNLNFPKPLNFLEEKKKFFKAIADDKFYNPQFIYEKKVFDKKKVNEFKKLNISTKNDIYGIKKLYKERLKTKYFEIMCHMNWGDTISTDYVIKYRGKPSRYLLSKAKTFCKYYMREKVKFKTLTHEEVFQRLNEYTRNEFDENLKVIFENIPSKVNIVPNYNLIKINPNSRITSLDVKRLQVHEIGVHYLRYYNGKKTGIKIFESGTSNYIETEEGLAVYAEELKGVSSKAQMYIYAGRVIGSFYALKIGFYDLYQLLRYYGFKREDAFAITFRAKRNISDTSKPGGFTKDYVYFSGYLKIKRFVRFHDINDLLIGKIKIEDLKILKKYIKKNKDKIKPLI